MVFQQLVVNVIIQMIGVGGYGGRDEIGVSAPGHGCGQLQAIDIGTFLTQAY